MRRLILIILLLWNSMVLAQNIIPQPRTMVIKNAKPVDVKDIEQLQVGNLPKEGYRINSKGGRLRIEFADSLGLQWARSTLGQMEDEYHRLPSEMTIEDYPATAIRGFMHDTGRNFIDLPTIKRHLWLMSFYKFNTFQWHLADNPGYRIECRAYPELNDKKFQSRDGGMFYTYDQIRDVISLAHELGIRVIPEIDIPGHSAYFDRTFGFSMDSPEGRKVLEGCFAEFFAEIPASDCPIVHIGSDEVQIADPTGFMRWAQDMVRRAGRTPMSWDPGLPSDSTTILQIWNTDRVEQRLLQGRPFVDSYVGYLNYYDPIYFVNKLFHHTPEPKSQGAILCLWNDVKVDDKFNIERHNGMVPGMMAFAERFWRGAKEDADFTEFESRMAFHRDHYCIHSPCYYVACGAMQWQIQVADTLLHTTGGAVDMDVLCANNNIKVDAPMALTATTTIYSKADTTIRAWVSFETPARSNRISLGIPEQGQWPQGFEVRVNGVAVEPPLWKEPGRYGINFNTWHSKENELPYTDEQFYWTRTPSYITLNKGENKVVVNAPKSFAGQRWSFAFIPLVINKNGVAVEFK